MSSPAPYSATKTHRLLSAAASTNGTSIKTSNGTVTHITGRMIRASAAYLKLYDKASAPTVGTDTPRKTLYLAASASFDFLVDDYFGAGIAYAITTAAADADTGALTAGDVVCLNIDYR